MSKLKRWNIDEIGNGYADETFVLASEYDKANETIAALERKVAERAFDHEFDIRSFNELAEHQSAQIAALKGDVAALLEALGTIVYDNKYVANSHRQLAVDALRAHTERTKAREGKP